MDKPNRPPRRKKQEHPISPKHILQKSLSDNGAIPTGTRDDLFMKETVNHFIAEFHSLFNVIARLEDRIEQNKYSDRHIGKLYLGAGFDGNSLTNYEQELEDRFDRMLRVCSMLKHMCLREQDHRVELTKSVRMCFDRCTMLLEEMATCFRQKYAHAQDTIRAQVAKSSMMRQQFTRTKAIYEALLDTAAQSIDILEGDVEKEKQKNVELTNKVDELEEKVKKLNQENENLKHIPDKMTISTTTDTAFKVQRAHTDDAVHGLKQEASEKAWTHIETLLEIAVSRLRLYEQDGCPNQYNHAACSTCSDSVSQASGDTSLPNAIRPAAVHHRNASFDTATAASNIKSSTPPHPPPRRHRHHSSLRKAVSTDGMLDQRGYNTNSTESLLSDYASKPPRDKTYKPYSQNKSDTTNTNTNTNTTTTKSKSDIKSTFSSFDATLDVLHAIPKVLRRRKSFASHSLSSLDSAEKLAMKGKGREAKRKGFDRKRSEADTESGRVNKGITDKELKCEATTEEGAATNGNGNGQRQRRLNRKRRSKTLVNFFSNHLSKD